MRNPVRRFHGQGQLARIHVASLNQAGDPGPGGSPCGRFDSGTSSSCRDATSLSTITKSNMSDRRRTNGGRVRSDGAIEIR